MPDEALWRSFFDEEVILDRLGVRDLEGDIVDLGCGYGNFALPAALRTRGLVYAYDIEEAMVDATRKKAEALGIGNLVTVRRDFVSEGTGLPSESCDYVMAFNILHAEGPIALLSEAYRILRPGGRAGVIHWIHDAATPRGPALEIRPRPEQCRVWLEGAAFAAGPGVIDLPPYHYGLVGTKR
jgi:SAM-dependent methyltransferase